MYFPFINTVYMKVAVLAAVFSACPNRENSFLKHNLKHAQEGIWLFCGMKGFEPGQQAISDGCSV